MSDFYPDSQSQALNGFRSAIRVEVPAYTGGGSIPAADVYLTTIPDDRLASIESEHGSLYVLDASGLVVERLYDWTSRVNGKLVGCKRSSGVLLRVGYVVKSTLGEEEFNQIWAAIATLHLGTRSTAWQLDRLNAGPSIIEETGSIALRDSEDVLVPLRVADPGDDNDAAVTLLRMYYHLASLAPRFIQVEDKAVDFNVTDTHAWRLHLVTTAGGAVTATLPDSATLSDGTAYAFKRSGAHVVIINDHDDTEVARLERDGQMVTVLWDDDNGQWLIANDESAQSASAPLVNSLQAEPVSGELALRVIPPVIQKPDGTRVGVATPYADGQSAPDTRILNVSPIVMTLDGIVNGIPNADLGDGWKVTAAGNRNICAVSALTSVQAAIVRGEHDLDTNLIRLVMGTPIESTPKTGCDTTTGFSSAGPGQNEYLSLTRHTYSGGYKNNSGVPLTITRLDAFWFYRQASSSLRLKVHVGSDYWWAAKAADLAGATTWMSDVLSVSPWTVASTYVEMLSNYFTGPVNIPDGAVIVQPGEVVFFGFDFGSDQSYQRPAFVADGWSRDGDLFDIGSDPDGTWLRSVSNKAVGITNGGGMGDYSIEEPFPIKFTYSKGNPLLPDLAAGCEDVLRIGTPTRPLTDAAETLREYPWNEVRDDDLSEEPEAGEVPWAAVPAVGYGPVNAGLATLAATDSLTTTRYETDYPIQGDGDVTLTSTPSITDGAFDGQEITLTNTTDDDVTLQDVTNLVGSGLDLGGADVTLGTGGVKLLKLRWFETLSQWVKVA